MMNNNMHKLITCIACFIICSHWLMGCVSNQRGSVRQVGPQAYVPAQQPNNTASRVSANTKLDVIIPVFDPGLSEQADDYAVEGIWPELRRAEANRFAYKLKHAFDDTRLFSAVRVTPDTTASGDLYLFGTIKESNGVHVEFDLEVLDISGKRWLSRTFSHEVQEHFYKGSRNDGKDSYDPIFKRAVAAVVKLLQAQSLADIDTLKTIADLRFGKSFNDAAFSEYMTVNNNRFKLVSKPSDNDPMLKRISAVRVHEQLFIDSLQKNYAAFTKKTDDSYLKWQEASFTEHNLYKQARSTKLKKALLGGLLIGLSAAAAVAAGNTSNTGSEAALSTTAVLGGLAGVWMGSGVFKSSQEAELHKDAVNELGESMDMELEPQVVSLQDETIELTGNIKEQFTQWRAFLQRIYEQEITPSTAL